MKRNSRWLIVAICVACLSLAACGRAPASTGDEAKPATVEHLEGVAPTRVTLTEEAAKHLDLQTAKVSEMTIDGKLGKVIPYAAIIYDTTGHTWTYVESRPQVFVRSPISVDVIKGDQALLTDGPDVGAAVVSVGAEELFGSETEFSEE